MALDKSDFVGRRRKQVEDEKREIGALVGTASLAERIPWGPVLLVALALFLLTVFDVNLQRQVVSSITGGYCGDGYCNPSENQYSCPADCRIATPSIEATPEPTEEPLPTPEPKIYELRGKENRLGFSNVDYHEVLDGSLKEVATSWMALPFNPDFPDEEMLSAVEDAHSNVVAKLQVNGPLYEERLAEVVGRYAGKAGKPIIEYYEIGADKGVEAVKAVYNGVKKGCPSCKLVVSVESSEINATAELAKACVNGCFDVIGLKEYDEANRSKTRYVWIAEDMRAIKKIFAGNKLASKQLWVSELGVYTGRVSTFDYRFDEEQASLLVRAIVFSLAQGAEKVFVSYPAGCFNTDKSYYCSLGISGAGSPSFAAFKKLKEAIDASNFSQDLNFTGTKKGYAFSASYGVAYVAWNDDFVVAYSGIGFDTPAKKVSVTDLVSQQAAEVEVRDGRFATSLREATPLLIRQSG